MIGNCSGMVWGIPAFSERAENSHLKAQVGYSLSLTREQSISEMVVLYIFCTTCVSATIGTKKHVKQIDCIRISWHWHTPGPKILYFKSKINHPKSRRHCSRNCIAYCHKVLSWSILLCYNSYFTDWSQGMPAIIRCRIFCVLSCYPNFWRLRYTGL
jgi:hypothetical protein